MQKRKIWRTLMTVGVLATATAVSGIAAYFTDMDEKDNNFTIGKVEIELQEEEWDKLPDENGNKIPDEAENLVPGQHIPKDPQVKNTGENDSYVFMTVEIPCEEVITVNEDGTQNPLLPMNLYGFDSSTAWQGIGCHIIKDDAGKTTAYKYLYAYANDDKTCKVLKPGDTTEPLFEEVVFVNVMEGQELEGETVSIPVQAYAIQTENLPEDTKNVWEIWSIITNQKELEESYVL